MKILLALPGFAAALLLAGRPAAAFCLDSDGKSVTVSGVAADGAAYKDGTYLFKVWGPSCASDNQEIVGVFGDGPLPCPNGAPVTVTGPLTHVIGSGGLFTLGIQMNFLHPESVACR
jgi:hypothetical protein